jgi:hypothetical protein
MNMSDIKNDLQLSIEANGSSGITIQAILSEGYNCVEFRLKENIPQPIFISPWMQFEPAAMNEERLKIAHEIVRRTLAYDELLKQVIYLQSQLEHVRDTVESRDATQFATVNMWRDERVKCGLPEDFSDITQWPPEMMGGYRVPKR